MPSGNTAFLRFGILTAVLSSFFLLLENRALAAPTPPSPAEKPYVVVLDPGHGGADHGASVRVGKKRITEKEIALGIAIRTSRVLENPDYWKPLGRPVKVILTRRHDKDVSLEQRSETARKAGADLFVSIHANADPRRRAHGLETYFLNNTDLKSATKLEQIENKSSRKYANADPASLLIRSVAADAVVESSRQAAQTLHQSLLDHLRSKEVPVHDRGVRQGMFYVLLDAQVPAVLVEAFFLTHPRDREFVRRPENRQKVAEGLAKGVLRHLALQ
jgi:N-acetylmuramoyl-L-alanine amidase